MAGRLPWAWGASVDELLRDYPADRLLDGPAVPMTRAVDVAAPVEVVWRWVCQLAVAPYSYDLVDNLGRRSPRTLTPGADALEVGQRMVMVFDLVEVEEPHQWTGIAQGWVAVTYAVHEAPGGSRLVCRMVAAAPGRLTRLRAAALAWGDLVMMRKQLLTLAALAERDHDAATANGGRGGTKSRLETRWVDRRR